MVYFMRPQPALCIGQKFRKFGVLIRSRRWALFEVHFLAGDRTHMRVGKLSDSSASIRAFEELQCLAPEELQCLASRSRLQPDGCSDTKKILELKLQAGRAFRTRHGSCFDYRVRQRGASARHAREQSEEGFEAVLRL